jgi:hypothetical protein
MKDAETRCEQAAFIKDGLNKGCPRPPDRKRGSGSGDTKQGLDFSQIPACTRNTHHSPQSRDYAGLVQRDPFRSYKSSRLKLKKFGKKGKFK